MPEYDVHSYRQIRVKVRGIEAASPAEAIAIVEANEVVEAEVHRLVDSFGVSGPVADVEYQDGGVPVGWLVDPHDPNEFGHGDGISYDATSDFEPVLRHDPDRMPTAAQKEILATFGIDDPSVAAYHDARNVAQRLDAIDPLAASLHRILDGADADRADAILDEAMRRIQLLRRNVADAANGPDSNIPPGVAAVLQPHGLTATFLEADDDQIDDELEIRKPGVVEPIASIQYCGPNDFMAGTWTSPAMDARRHGGIRRTAALAAEDAVAMLRTDGWL